ncbi:probable WRKY transcription factor 50 [Andrographis paniculata]|uniref:probable WRKY transcription factor 50 n=1 Tax=Andrographis paniculata TaxID=175694 RepID=UPI0021E81B38|nr:probable WRKY transcription factor 50 [Andrographis paniculata]
MATSDDDDPEMAAASFGSDSFEVSDFLDFGDWINDEANIPATSALFDNYSMNPMICSAVGDSSGSISSSSSSFQYGEGSGAAMKDKKAVKKKVAFKTKSEVEVLNDGFKWRKYGKKKVKNSPNPRNYYRCSVEGCPVKKRVERDKEDPRYVVTTYEGIHNHAGPI